MVDSQEPSETSSLPDRPGSRRYNLRNREQTTPSTPSRLPPQQPSTPEAIILRRSARKTRKPETYASMGHDEDHGRPGRSARPQSEGLLRRALRSSTRAAAAAGESLDFESDDDKPLVLPRSMRPQSSEADSSRQAARRGAAHDEAEAVGVQRRHMKEAPARRKAGGNERVESIRQITRTPRRAALARERSRQRGQNEDPPQVPRILRRLMANAESLPDVDVDSGQGTRRVLRSSVAEPSHDMKTEDSSSAVHRGQAQEQFSGKMRLGGDGYGKRPASVLQKQGDSASESSSMITKSTLTWENIHRWRKADLEVECKRRGLDSKGRRLELIARLRAELRGSAIPAKKSTLKSRSRTEQGAETSDTQVKCQPTQDGDREGNGDNRSADKVTQSYSFRHVRETTVPSSEPVDASRHHEEDESRDQGEKIEFSGHGSKLVFVQSAEERHTGREITHNLAEEKGHSNVTSSDAHLQSKHVMKIEVGPTDVVVRHSAEDSDHVMEIGAALGKTVTGDSADESNRIINNNAARDENPERHSEEHLDRALKVDVTSCERAAPSGEEIDHGLADDAERDENVAPRSEEQSDHGMKDAPASGVSGALSCEEQLDHFMNDTAEPGESVAHSGEKQSGQGGEDHARVTEAVVHSGEGQSDRVADMEEAPGESVARRSDETKHDSVDSPSKFLESREEPEHAIEESPLLDSVKGPEGTPQKQQDLAHVGADNVLTAQVHREDCDGNDKKVVPEVFGGEVVRLDEKGRAKDNHVQELKTRPVKEREGIKAPEENENESSSAKHASLEEIASPAKEDGSLRVTKNTDADHSGEEVQVRDVSLAGLAELPGGETDPVEFSESPLPSPRPGDFISVDDFQETEKDGPPSDAQAGKDRAGESIPGSSATADDGNDPEKDDVMEICNPIIDDNANDQMTKADAPVSTEEEIRRDPPLSDPKEIEKDESESFVHQAKDQGATDSFCGPGPSAGEKGGSEKDDAIAVGSRGIDSSSAQKSQSNEEGDNDEDYFPESPLPDPIASHENIVNDHAAPGNDDSGTLPQTSEVRATPTRDYQVDQAESPNDDDDRNENTINRTSSLDDRSSDENQEQAGLSDVERSESESQEPNGDGPMTVLDGGVVEDEELSSQDSRSSQGSDRSPADAGDQLSPQGSWSAAPSSQRSGSSDEEDLAENVSPQPEISQGRASHDAAADDDVICISSSDEEAGAQSEPATTPMKIAETPPRKERLSEMPATTTPDDMNISKSSKDLAGAPREYPRHHDEGANFCVEKNQDDKPQGDEEPQLSQENPVMEKVHSPESKEHARGLNVEGSRAEREPISKLSEAQDPAASSLRQASHQLSLGDEAINRIRRSEENESVDRLLRAKSIEGNVDHKSRNADLLEQQDSITAPKGFHPGKRSVPSFNKTDGNRSSPKSKHMHVSHHGNDQGIFHSGKEDIFSSHEMDVKRETGQNGNQLHRSDVRSSLHNGKAGNISDRSKEKVGETRPLQVTLSAERPRKRQKTSPARVFLETFPTPAKTLSSLKPAFTLGNALGSRTDAVSRSKRFDLGDSARDKPVSILEKLSRIENRGSRKEPMSFRDTMTPRKGNRVLSLFQPTVRNSFHIGSVSSCTKLRSRPLTERKAFVRIMNSQKPWDPSKLAAQSLQRAQEVASKVGVWKAMSSPFEADDTLQDRDLNRTRKRTPDTNAHDTNVRSPSKKRRR